MKRKTQPNMQKPKMRKIAKLSALFLSAAFIATALPTTATAKAPVPIDYWAIRHAVNSVEVSPDGKHVLVLKLESKEGQNVLEIYSTDDFSQPLKRLTASPMEIFNARWVSDNVISGSAWKFVRKKVKRPEDSAFDFLLYSYNLKTNKFKKLEPDKTNRFEGNGFQIVNVLPKEPDTILIASGNEVGAASGVDPLAIIRPRSYYRYNLETGNKVLVLKGNEKYGNIQFDGKGNPIFAAGLDQASHEFINYYRLPGQKTWTEYGDRLDGDNDEDVFEIIAGFPRMVGKKKGDKNIAWIIAHRDEDKAAIWEYDLTANKYGRKIYQNPNKDVLGTLDHSNTWGQGADADLPIVAAVYPGAKMERHWFDMAEKALYEQFESKIPNAHQVTISSRSRDGQTMIVQNRGPKDPGSFWLVKNGKMAKLGSRNPLLKPEDLANVEYIQYKARDGLTIDGYLTVPNSPGPHPLIVLPHGGPHVNEVIIFDEWSQFLANNGYMVLQPQYRISVGHGRKHWESSKDQHGLKMQDDKDDGAQYLIDKGLVEKDRVAMFGWSYGGYAALVAASRTPQMYQCVIAGAAVADAKKVYLKRKGSGSMKALDHWSQARGGFFGVNPIEELDKVNIPVMMVHGDLDARVLYFNFKDYKKEMVRTVKTKSTGRCTGGTSDSECTVTLYRTSTKGDGIVPMGQQSIEISPNGNTTSVTKSAYTGKSRFVTLKGADHFSITLMYKHQKKLYTEMLDFLQNDCGPGGL